MADPTFENTLDPDLVDFHEHAKAMAGPVGYTPSVDAPTDASDKFGYCTASDAAFCPACWCSAGLLASMGVRGTVPNLNCVL